MTIDEIKRQMFIDSEEVCGNTMIDTYQAQEYVEQAYNKAIDDFVNICEKQFTTMYGQRYVDMRDIKNIAEQLKAGAFFPYIETETGQTICEQLEEEKQFLLEG